MERIFTGQNRARILRLALIVSISFISFPDCSYSASQPKPAIEGLIAKAISDGEAEIITPAMAEKLGYGSGQIVAKTIRIPHKVSPDGQDHSFSVIVHSDNVGHSIPDALELMVGKGKREGEKIIVDGMVFGADVGGQLKKAFHNSGVAGELKSEELEISKRKIKKAFQHEIDLFLASLK